MNLGDLEEAVWRSLGLHDQGNRLDWRRQEIRDALNMALDEVSQAGPLTFSLMREGAIALVAGTDTYALDDWTKRPIGFYTTDAAAHKVMMRLPRAADRDGSRAGNAVFGALGPWQLTLAPRSSTAAKSGDAASAAEGSVTVTKVGGVAWSTVTDVGRMLRLNGENGDYKITAVAGANSLTVDRPVRGRLAGTNVTGVGVGYTTKRWEIGPPGRFQIQILPKPSEARTLPYRYQAQPRRVLSASDTPELLEEYHHLLWKRTLHWISGFNEDDASYARFAQEYGAALQELRLRDADDMDSEESANYESMLDGGNMPRGLPNDAWSRR